MLGGVQWQVLAPFCAGSLVGAAVGGMTVVELDPAVLNIGLACFILYLVWAPPLTAPGRFKVVATGAFSSFLTMFFGATGTFVSAMVKSMRLGRLGHVATHAACMLAQHSIKVVAFGLLRSEEHTSELQSLMRISYAVFCLTKKTQTNNYNIHS